ncbi:MAG: transposase, partial [Mycobacteriaceae bacterium]|nr:transposase [Mycobacteriaceae bacterium]
LILPRPNTGQQSRTTTGPLRRAHLTRAVLREPNLPAAFHDPISWELRLLVDRREDLVGQRVAVANRLIGRLHQLSPDRPKPSHLERSKTQSALSEYLQAQHGLLAELARQELADIGYLTTAIDSVTENIASRVNELDSALLKVPGCAELTAAKLIGETANVDRFRSEAAFARYVGTAPVPRSSGATGGRLRASRSGNRQCNAALHRIAIVQLRLEGPGRQYYLRRRDEGDTAATAIHCLKRRLCRVIYNRLRTDYQHRTSSAVRDPKLQGIAF